MSYFNLKNTLIIDAITCGALFLLCVFATATVAALLGLLIFDQLPDLLSVVGMLIIGASGLSLALYRPRAAIVNLSEGQ